MIVQNENTITFLILSAPFSFLSLPKNFWGEADSLLFTPLIMFLHQPHTKNHPLSSFMVKPLTIQFFRLLVVLVLFLFLLMNEQSSNLVLVFVASLAMMYPKKAFIAMTTSLIAFVSPVMLSSRNNVLS